jgi:hypothetical protein
MASNLAESPACLEEGHRHTTADFKLEFGAFRSHTALIGSLQQPLKPHVKPCGAFHAVWAPYGCTVRVTSLP